MSEELRWERSKASSRAVSKAVPSGASISFFPVVLEEEEEEKKKKKKR